MQHSFDIWWVNLRFTANQFSVFFKLHWISKYLFMKQETCLCKPMLVWALGHVPSLQNYLLIIFWHRSFFNRETSVANTLHTLYLQEMCCQFTDRWHLYVCRLRVTCESCLCEFASLSKKNVVDKHRSLPKILLRCVPQGGKTRWNRIELDRMAVLRASVCL